MYEPLVLTQAVAALVTVITGGVPPSGIAALVFRVADHAVQGGIMERTTLPSAYAAAVQIVGDRPQTEFSGGVALEYLTDDGGFRINDFQPSICLVVAEQVVLSEQNAVLLRPLESEACAFGQLTHLILCDRGHDGEPQFGVLVEGVDVVVLEVHAHAEPQQLARVAQTVKRVSGETADLLGDNEIKRSAFGILDHFEELLAPLDRRAADALIDIAAGERPVRIFGNAVLKIAFLVAQTVDLLVFVGRNAGVVRHSKLGIENTAALRLHFVQSADSIARAILKNSPILLLDEATASLDIENELAVKQAIANLLKEKKTVVMIAHTLSIVKNADQILVMGDGGIAESGTHEELLAKGGKYAAMWNAEQKISA